MNNKSVHHEYFRCLKDSLNMLRETVEEDRIEKPLNSDVVDTYFLTKRSRELLEYIIDTCPKFDNKQDRVTASSLITKNKHVTVDVPLKTS